MFELRFEAENTIKIWCKSCDYTELGLEQGDRCFEIGRLITEHFDATGHKAIYEERLVGTYEDWQFELRAAGVEPWSSLEAL